MVMDKNLLHNIPVSRFISRKPIHIYKMQSKTILRYFIQVRKVDQICVQTTKLRTNEYVIYDGPSIFTDTVKTKNVHRLSTFQCGIYMLTLNLLPKLGKYIKFHAKSLPFSEYRKINGTEIYSEHLPNTLCSHTLCVIFLHAKTGHQINVTVTEIKKSGLKDYFCIYSGLVAGENLKDDYRQTQTLCKNVDGTVSPNFYSHNSSLVLVYIGIKFTVQ